MPEARRTSVGLCVHSLTPDLALLVWEGATGGARGRLPRATVGGRPAAPPHIQIRVPINVAWGPAHTRNIMVVRADAAAVRQQPLSIEGADGVLIAVAVAGDGPAGRSTAFAPARLVAGVDGVGRMRIVRLMLEVIPGIYRLGDNPAFAAACIGLAAALAPTPPALLPCSTLFGRWRLFACGAGAAAGANPSAVVVSGGRVRRAPFAPAFASEDGDGSGGQLYLALPEPAAQHPDAVVFVHSDRGMILRRIATAEQPVPSARTWLGRSSSARAKPAARRYVLDCLADLGRQDAQAAALVRALQAMVPPVGGAGVLVPAAATADFTVTDLAEAEVTAAGSASGAASNARGIEGIPLALHAEDYAAAAGNVCHVIDIGQGPRMPDAAVISVVPDDPLLMRCRAGLFVAEPGMGTVEVLYVLARPQKRQEVTQFLRGLHAAYGIAARLIVVPHGATAAAALNAGINVSRAAMLVLLGGTVVPERPAWLAALTRQLGRRATIGIVAGRLMREDQTLWNDGLAIGSDRDAWDIHPIRAGFPRGLAITPRLRRVAGVSSGCIAMTRSVFETCGGFSPHYLSLDYSVADFCLTAAAAGLTTWLTGAPAFFRLDPPEGERPGREALDPDRYAEIDRRLLERRWRARLEAAGNTRGGRAA